ncbi:phosphatidylserine/phosphatidylglycerophosphate/cardiolipin synthase family protein [Paenibacillus filicis]|uniref:Phosphatidylserine/phosphatidylglycerophosphate/ cardiolipin synthase family protein n=1 Tax=Paenibacillus filicis TaxID=669464 RepID=A0ABU9DJ67_9BACL
MNQTEHSLLERHESYIPPVADASYPPRSGNRLQPLVDSAPTFRRICEAIEAAQHSVWIAVTFMDPDFEMPDGRGSVLDVLDRAAARGLDVRVLCWRPNPESSGYGQAFPGSPADHERLAARGSRFLIRWDRAHGYFCQHQKFWLVDAGNESETAFIGGINPTFGAFEPGHRGEGQRHDIYVEVTGPSATDVHHNFVQRWNEASERAEADGVWGHDGDDELALPDRVSAPRGDSLVQIQRNVHAGRYFRSYPVPGGSSVDIAAGERAVTEQYIQAIDAARRSIYIENQALPVPEIAARLEAALKRGVEIVLLVPAEPESYVRTFRQDPSRSSFFESIEALGRYDNFTLAGIAGPNELGIRSPIYVHAKIMLIDDVWATIGSCNLHFNSINGHTEMNASIWDAKMVRMLRCQLLSEHLGQETAHLEDREALCLYRSIAGDNRRRAERGDFDWQGLAISLDTMTYGEPDLQFGQS